MRVKNFAMSKSMYRVCTKCVMDTSDPKIEFNSQGVCDHCLGFEKDVEPNWHPNEHGRELFSKTVDEIKEKGKNNQFDCIMGMSGGLDSSYLLHMAVTEFGLRPLVFHVDAGWNTDLAVNNIQMLVEKLDLDLYTEVIDWNDVREFQLALFKSGTPHLDLAQDHAFFATMYHFAEKHKIKYILNGGNYSTECIRNPLDWLYYGTDMAFLNDVLSQFASFKLENYPFSGILYHKVYLRYFKNIRVVKPLNLMPYVKDEAIEMLSSKYAWRPYPQKHFESRFTKFYEGYWLPTRFGYDTRRVQFSSLIVTGQMTREAALEMLEKPSYDEDTIEEDFSYIANKLGITERELRKYHEMELKWFRDYKNLEWMFNLGAKTMKLMGNETAIKR